MVTATNKTAQEEVIPDLAVEKPKLSSEPDMPNRSRLKNTLESNSKKTLLLSLLGIFLIIAILAIFGIPALIKMAEITSNREDPSVAEEKEAVLVLPPDLSRDKIATNSAEITISGTAEDGESVKLYKDGKLIEEEDVAEDTTFAFKNVELKEGTNSFKVKAFLKENESKFSDTLVVTYRKEAPKLFIDYPSEGQGISNKDGDRLQVEGSTDPDMTVTINGSQVILDDEGKFKQFIPINGGENTIKAVATDNAGNKTELERKFTYNR